MQFTATALDSASSAVRWQSAAGNISPTGLFIAPEVSGPQTVLITAVSMANPLVRGEAAIAITPTISAQLKIVAASLPQGTASVPFNAALSATGGAPPYTWSIASGSLPEGLRLNSSSGDISGTTKLSGVFSFGVQVSDSADSTGSATLALVIDSASGSGNNFDGPAELPRVYLNSALANTPAPGKTISVASGGDLQGALDAANCGDTIGLQPGATFTGRFLIPAKACDDQHWIIVRTSAPDSSLPAEGTRLTPCYAGYASLPGRPIFQCASIQNVMAKIVYDGKNVSGPLVFSQGATHYRLVGLEITRSNPQTHYRNLVQTEDVDVQADHLVFDRMWIHGTATDETKAGINVSGMSSVSIVDSYFTDFHCISTHGSCVDSQAISGGTGDTQDGPFKIVNNFLEASGESILLGGGPGSTTPADIEVRHNHMFKPLIWQPGNSSFVGAYTGDPYIAKNSIELKNAQRVLFEGNVLENVWGGFTQHGISVLLMPSNQGGHCPQCRVSDITFRYNAISHVGGGMAMGTSFIPATEGARYSVHDVIIDDIDRQRFNGAGSLFLLANTWAANALGSVTVNHVTGFPDGRVLGLLDPAPDPKMGAFVFTNNLVGPSGQPIAGAGGGATNCALNGLEPELELSPCFDSYVFNGNVLVGVNKDLPPSKWPANNYFPAGMQEVGFARFNDGSGGDYQLLSSSPYKNAGSDGKDIGADVAAVESAVSGAY